MVCIYRNRILENEIVHRRVTETSTKRQSHGIGNIGLIPSFTNLKISLGNRKHFPFSHLYRELRDILIKCASTALSSKLVARQKEFFSAMVVDAVMQLDELLPLNMIGIKKVQGGGLEVGV